MRVGTIRHGTMLFWNGMSPDAVSRIGRSVWSACHEAGQRVPRSDVEATLRRWNSALNRLCPITFLSWRDDAIDRLLAQSTPVRIGMYGGTESIKEAWEAHIAINSAAQAFLLRPSLRLPPGMMLTRENGRIMEWPFLRQLAVDKYLHGRQVEVG